MDINEINSLISNLGLPIVCCIVLGKYFIKQNDNMIQTLKEYVEKERETTKEKYEDSKTERERELDILDKLSVSMEKISASQELILQKIDSNN